MKPRYILPLLLLFAAIGISCESDDPTDVKDVLHVRRNNADIPAYVFGNVSSNTFIIVLHGGPGGSGMEYRFGAYAEQLEQQYGVVYTDQRGQGMSQGNYSLEDLTIDEMAEDVRALALTLKFKYGQDINLFLMGHSWGGTLGTAVMIKDDYQDLFEGWIEVDGAHDIPLIYRGGIRLFDSIGQQQISEGNSVEFWQEILDSLAIMDINAATPLDEHTLFLNQKGFEAEDELLNAGILEESDFTNIGESFANALYFNNALTSWWSGRLTNGYLSEAEIEGYSATNQLNRITTPTLLLWGRYDFVVSPELGYSALEEISAEDKELIIFDRSGHSPMSNEPDAFVAAVVSFIERNN